MAGVIIAVIDVLWAAFSRLVATQAGRWILQALLFFGISFVSNKVVSGAVSPALASAFGGIGGKTIEWISFMNVDRALTTVLSAYATVSASRWTIKRTSSTSQGS